MTALTITCIIPARNAERFLRDALDSVLRQTTPITEILVIDDGSTDSTIAIAESYGGAVRCVSVATTGQVAARNHGVTIATGDYITFLDADDIWELDKTERQLAALAARPDSPLVIGSAQSFWEDELAEEAERLARTRRAQPVVAYSCAAMLAHRSVFDRVGLFDESRPWAHQPEWFARAQRLGIAPIILPTIVYWRRLHRGGVTRQVDGARADFLRFVREQHHARRATDGAGPPR